MPEFPEDHDPYEACFLHRMDYQNVIVLAVAAWALSIAFSIVVFAYS